LQENILHHQFQCNKDEYSNDIA